MTRSVVISISVSFQTRKAEEIAFPANHHKRRTLTLGSGSAFCMHGHHGSTARSQPVLTASPFHEILLKFTGVGAMKKSYQKPTLTRREVLSKVTAQDNISGRDQTASG